MPDLKPKPSPESQVALIMALAVGVMVPVVVLPWVVSNYLEDRKARARERNYRLLKGI